MAPLLLPWVMLIFLSQINKISSFEFQVGGSRGWVIPPANETDIYNKWASEKRFQVGDSIRFKYEKDSVMVVNKQEYETCNSSQPSYFSNNGNSVFRFEYSGSFYFISGMTRHCEKGEKMIIRVLAEEGHKRSSSASSAIFSMPIVWTQLAFSCHAIYYCF